MSDLSPEAEDLVRAGKRAGQPSDADRQRITDALRGRLGDAVVLGEPRGWSGAGGGAPAIHAGMSRWLFVGLAGVAGGALLYGLHFGRTPPAPPGHDPGMASAAWVAAAPATESSSPIPAVPVPEASAVTRGPSAPPGGAIRSVRPVEARPAGSLPARDGLSDEVAILSRAETDLHSGRFEAALKALDEHERRFPSGVLAEERTAARIQALCALGRTAEADAQLTRLARTVPHSPHEERARQACRDALGGAHP